MVEREWCSERPNRTVHLQMAGLPNHLIHSKTSPSNPQIFNYIFFLVKINLGSKFSFIRLIKNWQKNRSIFFCMILTECRFMMTLFICPKEFPCQDWMACSIFISLLFNYAFPLPIFRELKGETPPSFLGAPLNCIPAKWGCQVSSRWELKLGLCSPSRAHSSVVSLYFASL